MSEQEFVLHNIMEHEDFLVALDKLVDQLGPGRAYGLSATPEVFFCHGDLLADERVAGLQQHRQRVVAGDVVQAFLPPPHLRAASGHEERVGEKEVQAAASDNAFQEAPQRVAPEQYLPIDRAYDPGPVRDMVPRSVFWLGGLALVALAALLFLGVVKPGDSPKAEGGEVVEQTAAPAVGSQTVAEPKGGLRSIKPLPHVKLSRFMGKDGIVKGTRDVVRVLRGQG